MKYFTVELPRTYEYEWSATNTTNESIRSYISDNCLLTDLSVGRDSDPEKKGHYFRDAYYRFGLYTNRVFLPIDQNKRRSRKKVGLYIYKTTKPELDAFRQKVMEMRAHQNHLDNGIEFLSNNVSEWMDENYREHYRDLFEAYQNYNCYANVSYCEHQMKIDQDYNRANDSTGNLIMGSNWYDERYENILGVNIGGIYPKTFKHPDSSFSTVGFRYVLRLKPSYFSWHLDELSN